ncbi:LysR substrate-binding domain-containing protein [Aquabacterium sp.]|uniref:LysR substrate-binding domain-containing protein n=1 Tax=Aquabacterium sp. TaxID=1872578 RepID=UPI002D1AE14D|nr:LysR substrate-binding domain-containing protein [Aquabacterium sp.]HSW04680.1 LysR substrate-binding domain-containing protein [Aquabacterium sp.]
MKVHQLKALVAIGDHGSIRAASRAAGLSPAAVTKAVRELEDDLKTLLITREAKGVTFTEAGRALLVHARLVVGQLARAQEEMDVLVGRQQAPLRIGIGAWIALTCLGDVVTLFQQRLPAVRLEFFEGILTVSIPKLRDGTLDFCIGRSCPASMQDDFAHVPLFRTSSAVIAREGHPLAGSRSLAELKHAQWLLNWTPADDPAQRDDVFSRYLREYAPTIHVAHSFVIAMSLIRHTDMLGLMAWPLVEAVAARERLCVLPLAETLNEATASLITRRGDPLSAAAQCFIDCFNTVVYRALSSADPARRRLFHSIDGLAMDDRAMEALERAR